jgi:N6-L-threonylcarbamoyladenine synthase
MRILAIETSCDETAVALVEADPSSTSGQEATYNILGNALFSQASLHEPYGGVYPNLAKREHIKNLPILLEKALGNEKPEGIDLIAVTSGPGLEPALWTGITFAEELGKKWSVPVMGIDHMEGHVFSALLKKQVAGSRLQGAGITYHLPPTTLPLLALLISGGHTELVLMKQWFEYELVGRTKDDSIGEAFDKVARMLDLGYPGGPVIARLAEQSRAKAPSTKHEIPKFPRPMAHDNTCDFSFSGLKTAVLYKLRTMPKITDAEKAHIAEAFEDAARDVIVIKTRRALKETNPATLVVGGGVSANFEIRKGLERLIREEFSDTKLAYPDKSLTGDNAIMIAAAAHLRCAAGHTTPGPLTASGSQSLAQPRRATVQDREES